MVKRLIKHTLYEIWCEFTAESAFIDHKPTWDEVQEIRAKLWPGVPCDKAKREIRIFKLTPVFTKGKKI